jgi:hypothetical protein
MNNIYSTVACHMLVKTIIYLFNMTKNKLLLTIHCKSGLTSIFVPATTEPTNSLGLVLTRLGNHSVVGSSYMRACRGERPPDAY